MRPDPRRPARQGRSRPRRPRAGLLLALLAPAALMASGLALALPSGGGPAGATTGARAAGAAASAPPLQPLVLLAARGRRLLPASELGGGRRPAAPVEIAIPAADVRAPVDAVGSTPAGIEVPELGRAGWHRGGPRPGEPGRAVIIGHLDSQTGPGVFARVAILQRGAAIAVRDGRGESHPYRVTSRRQVAKTRFPAEQVYGATRERLLVLVTCGGPFTPRRGYRDNVIVYARPA